MKKQYTKKQIQEAIKYWKKQLGALNEAKVPYAPQSAKLEFVFPDPVGNTELAPFTPEVMRSVFGIDPDHCYVLFRIDKYSGNSVAGVKLGQHPTDDAPGSTAIILDTISRGTGEGLTYPQFYEKTQGIKDSNSFIVREPAGDAYWCAEKITITNNSHTGPLFFIDADSRTDRIA